MPKKRGRRWIATGWDRRLGYMKHLGTFDTRREAKDAETEYYKESGRPACRETCDEFAKRWVRDYPRPEESTNRHNAERVKRFSEDFKGVRLSDISKPDARKWAMAHRGHLGSVRAMFGDAVRDGLIQSNPFAQLRLPGSKGRKELVALTEKELQDLADLALKMDLGVYAEHYRAMILFAGYVGCRPGELFALKQEDLADGLCVIERAYKSSTGMVGNTKNKKSRTVIVPPPALEVVGDIPRVTDLLFESPSGRMWSQASHHPYWKALRLIAGRPDLDFYSLRHTCATLLMERGAAPWEVAQQLGHTDGGQLVAELYGHPRDEVARARMAALWESNVEPLRSANG